MDSLLHSDLQLFFEYFQSKEINEFSIYALIDAAQDRFFLKKNYHLQARNLLTEAAGVKAAEISPHLVKLSHISNNIEWQYINRKVVGTPRMTIIISALSFDDLYTHLRQFTNVKFVGGLEMFLAFWDPTILGTLLGQKTDLTLYIKQQVLSPEQKKVLLEPIHCWWYWDRLKHLQKIEGKGQNDLLRFYDWRNPLEFTVEQEEQMIEATFPDLLIYYLKLNNPFLVENFNSWDLYQYVIEKISQAREYTLNGTRDILNFICLNLIYKDNFENNKQLQSSLLNVKANKITMDQAMEEIEFSTEVS